MMKSKHARYAAEDQIESFDPSGVADQHLTQRFLKIAVFVPIVDMSRSISREIRVIRLICPVCGRLTD